VNLSHGACSLKAGYFFDPEDSRKTRRLQGALAVLEQMGVQPTTLHHTDCAKHASNAGRGVRYPGYCSNLCTVEWPKYVTDEMLQMAWTIGDTTATLRGIVTNAKAAAERAAAASEVR